MRGLLRRLRPRRRITPEDVSKAVEAALNDSLARMFRCVNRAAAKSLDADRFRAFHEAFDFELHQAAARQAADVPMSTKEIEA